jgi:peptide subunit release factor 1 (eRF1)
MLGRGVLSRLYTLTQHEVPTLTVYVDVDQNTQSNRNRGYVVQTEAMLKELRSTAGGDAELEPAAGRALSMVEGLEPQGKTALVVVHEATRLAEIHLLQVACAPSAQWQRGAFLRPVVEAMDEHERYGVVLTDSQRARLFTVFMGEITEHEDLVSDTTPKARALGGDQLRAQKRVDNRREQEAAAHAKRIVDALADLSLRSPFDRLIVAGPPKSAGQLVRLLPRRMHGKLVETISLPIGASGGEVLARILDLQHEMERAQEQELVAGLVAELHDGGKAVAELPSVLDAVNQGRVWKLVYVKGLRVEGGECPSCGSYVASPTGPCFYCGEAVRTLPRCIDRITQRVLETGGRVDAVEGPAADALTGIGSIAALLRY